MSEVYLIGASCAAFGQRAGAGFEAQHRCELGVEQRLADREVGLLLARAMGSPLGDGAAAASSASTRRPVPPASWTSTRPRWPVPEQMDGRRRQPARRVAWAVAARPGPGGRDHRSPAPRSSLAVYGPGSIPWSHGHARLEGSLQARM